MLNLFASCLPGLEPLLAQEVRELGVGPVIEAGGVSFEGDWRIAYRANHELGLCSHLLARVASFHVRSLGELVRKTAKIDWQEWLRDDVPVSVRAVAKKSRLYHTGAICQRIVEGVGAVSDVPIGDADQDGAITVAARFNRDECTLSIDLSGQPLHRRGWRLDPSSAPLREDLARALVLVSGWDGEGVFIDPMTGSGTIAVEAANFSRRLPPGRGRSFSFEQMAGFDDALWQEVKETALQQAHPRPRAEIFARDIDPKAVSSACENARRAGVLEDIDLEAGSFRDAPFLRGEPLAPEVGALVVNPPFGKRVGRGDLGGLYQALGHDLRQLPDTWKLAMLTADRRLALRTGVALKTGFLTRHGGLQVRALVRGG